MKKFLLVISTMAFVLSFNFSANASDSGWATQTGPLVMCDYPDGSRDYIPTMICTYEGGTFDPNVGQQW